MIDDNSENTSSFAKKTFKEVRIWDWLARLIPLSVLAILTVLHYFKWTDTISLILEISLILFVITCFIWWYWALYKIAASIKILQSAEEKFDAIRKEFKTLKENLSGTVDKDK